jgi:hypothetical protein
MKILIAIVLGGLTAGALDILSAFATYVPRGATEMGILQYIASGALGPGAMDGGWRSAAIGLGAHFALTLAMAAVFALASLVLPVVARAAWITGPIYGVIVYAAMTYLIVPHSAVENWKPAEGWALVGGLMAHIFYVGLPIALIARAFIGAPAAK